MNMKVKTPRQVWRIPSTPLLAQANVICCRARHTIGLTAKGQLIFSHHTPKELKRHWKLAALTRHDECECAVIFKHWIEGFESNRIPEVVARERFAWNNGKDSQELVQRFNCEIYQAHRIVSRRRCERYRLRWRKGVYGLALSAGGSWNGAACEAASKVASELQVRGWPISSDRYLVKAPSRESLLSFVERGKGYLEVRTAGQRGRDNLTTINKDNVDGYDLRWLADRGEYELIKSMLAAKKEEVRHKEYLRISELNSFHTSYNNEMTLRHSVNNLHAQPENKPLEGSISFYVEHLTPLAGKYLKDYIQTTLTRLDAILRASAERMARTAPLPEKEFDQAAHRRKLSLGEA